MGECASNHALNMEVPQSLNCGQTGHSANNRGWSAYKQIAARREPAKISKTSRLSQVQQTVTQLSQSLTSIGLSLVQACLRASFNLSPFK